MVHSKLIILLLMLSFQLSGQKTVLTGKATDYTAKEITFYTLSDPVLREKLELATTSVGSDGSFSLSFTVARTIEICADLEKYCGTMVIEPGKSYEITLPPYSLRNSVEAHSPYFKPAPYWLGLPGRDTIDVNYAVRSFITEFNSETVKNTNAIYQKKSKAAVAEIIERLKKKYGSVENSYFKTLVNYYFAELEYTVNERTPGLIIQKYFAINRVELHHPVYQRAFEMLFTDYLRKQAMEIQNRKLTTSVNHGNYLELVDFFEKKGFKKEFAELVVLKGLNDGYYTGSFSKEGVLKALEMAQTATTSESLRPIAQQIRTKLSHLATGGKAPALKLANLKNETVSLDQFKGKFVLLSFINSKSSDCKAELDSMVTLEKKLRQVLVMVSVSTDDNFDNAVQFWKTKGYTWPLLNGAKQKQLISSYNASVTPAFYLIDPNGMLKLSPSPSPSRGFEPLFLKLFRDFSFKQQRN